MNIGEQVKGVLDRATSEIGDIMEEKARYDDDATCDKFSDEYRKEAARKAGTCKVLVGNKVNSTIDACDKLIKEYRASCIANNRLKGSEITDDAKLFSLGVDLPVEEIEAIFDRSSGNMTMQRLCRMYADQHGMKLNRVPVSNYALELNALNDLESVVHMYCNNWIHTDKAREMLKKFFV